MIFNSFTFGVFFTIFFFLYWFVFNKTAKSQNLFLLLGSYVFYAWADSRFLLLLIGVSLLNFYLGIHIAKATNQTYKKLLLWIGMLQGIGMLVFFKYFNFFITSINNVFSSLNINPNLHTLNIIIPLGISFFTFRILSYLFDINTGKIKPTTDWIVFFAYVSFFPSLLSGPIDKARMFIPQLEKTRVFNYDDGTDGLRQILWGLFKKIVIADSCQTIVETFFNDYQNLPGSSLLLGAFFYAIQLYADFSGYSDMAIGIGRLLGFNVTKNFDFPFFTQNIAEFWRKWHISLTSWLTEYLFTPLSIAFRDLRKVGLILAITINFVIVGLWHGANWTYAMFGFVHGCYFIPLILSGSFNKKKKISKDQVLPSLTEGINMLMTFTLVMLALIIFRADSLSQAFHYFSRLFSVSLFKMPEIPSGRKNAIITMIFVIAMFIVEWFQRDKNHGLQIDTIKHPVLRLSIYYAIVSIIYFFGTFTDAKFIYFQF